MPIGPGVGRYLNPFANGWSRGGAAKFGTYSAEFLENLRDKLS